GRSHPDYSCVTQLIQVITDARSTEVAFALEWPWDIVRRGGVAINLDNGKDEIFGFVESGQYFVLCDGHRCGILDAPLHFDEAQFACAWDTRFDIVTTFIGADISWHVAKLPFGLHHCLHGYALDTSGLVGTLFDIGNVALSCEPVQQSLRDDEDAAYHHGWQRRKFALL